MTGKPTPRAISDLIESRLQALRNPEKAEGMARYFRKDEGIRFFGLTAPQLRGIARETVASVRPPWAWMDAAELCEIGYRRVHYESRTSATLVLLAFLKPSPRPLFDRIKSWLAADLLNNWALVDTLCPDALGGLLRDHPSLAKEIVSWTRHPNRWVKRASAVGFIKLARHGLHLDAIYEIAEKLLPVDDDLVHKATGWLLREAGKADLARLRTFLLKNGPAVPRTALRYAIERFPEPERMAILKATRSKETRR